MTSKDQTENERRLDDLEDAKPQPFTVKRLAQAFAIANGHDDTEAYAAKVVEAWKTIADEPARSIQEARDDRAKE